jgi:hypothetical protein
MPQALDLEPPISQICNKPCSEKVHWNAGRRIRLDGFLTNQPPDSASLISASGTSPRFTPTIAT